MFNEVVSGMTFIDNLTLQKINNLGVYYELNKKFYSEKNNEQIGYDDNRGLYMFAIRDKVDVTQLNEFQSCGSLQVTQKYYLKFLTDCSWAFWLMKDLQKKIFAETVNIDGITMLMNTINETRLTESLLLTEIEVTFTGNVNDCDYTQLQCCCT
jgi:hypothetical protein